MVNIYLQPVNLFIIVTPSNQRSPNNSRDFGIYSGSGLFHMAALMSHRRRRILANKNTQSALQPGGVSGMPPTALVLFSNIPIFPFIFFACALFFDFWNLVQYLSTRERSHSFYFKRSLADIPAEPHPDTLYQSSSHPPCLTLFTVTLSFVPVMIEVL